MAYSFLAGGNHRFKEKGILFGCRVLHGGSKVDESMERALNAYIYRYRGMQLPSGVFNPKAITKQDISVLIRRCAQRMYDPEAIADRSSMAILVERFIADAIYSCVPRVMTLPRFTGLEAVAEAAVLPVTMVETPTAPAVVAVELVETASPASELPWEIVKTPTPDAVISLPIDKTPTPDAIVSLPIVKTPSAAAVGITTQAEVAAKIDCHGEDEVPVGHITSRRPAPMELVVLFNKKATCGDITELARNTTAPQLSYKSPFDFANMADVLDGLTRYTSQVLGSKIVFEMPTFVPAKSVTYSKDSSGKNIRLGEGMSSVVYLADVDDHNTPGGHAMAAIKCFKKDKPFRMSSFFGESSHLKRMSGQDTSPHLYGFAIAEESALYHRLVLATQFLGDPKTLKAKTIECLIEENYDFIEQNDERLYNAQYWLRVVLGLFNAMENLHRLQICVADINTDNLIWNEEKSVVYSFDYGLACYFGEKSPYPCLAGQRAKNYLANHPQVAPELVNASEHRAHPKTDIYAAGYIMRRIADYGLISELDELSSRCRCEDAEERIDVRTGIGYLWDQLQKLETC